MDFSKPLNILPEKMACRCRMEAKYLLSELKRCKMNVVLIPAPYQRFEGHMIRQAQGQNPAWYSALFWSDEHNFRRWRVLRALDRFLKGKDRMNNSYDNRLRQLIYGRLTQGYEDEGAWIEPELKDNDFAPEA